MPTPIEIGIGKGWPMATGQEDIPAYDAAVGDEANYYSDIYTGYCSPFNALVQGWKSGREFADGIQINSATAPNRSRINWRMRSGRMLTNQIGGYMFWAWNLYEGGYARRSIPPKQVSQITRLMKTFDWRWTGSTQFNLLVDRYLRSSTDPASKQIELGHFLHAPQATIDFHMAGASVGTYTDPWSRAWTVRTRPADFDATHSGSYVTFLPSDMADVLIGAMDERDILNWLLAQSVITSDLYYAGTALGVEPLLYGGSGSMILNGWDVTMS